MDTPEHVIENHQTEPIDILVIEDEETIRDNIIFMLMGAGLSAIGVENGLEGSEWVKRQLPKLIVCDISMPVMGGYEFLSRLRQSPRTEKIPLIFLTARSGREDWRKGLELGADDYITKPFKSHDLLTAVHNRLHRQQVIENFSQNKVNKLKEHLMINLPHELRTPLTAIMGFSEMLMDSFETLKKEEIRSMLRDIYKSGQRLSALVENHLFFARIETLAINQSQLIEIRAAVTDYPGHLIEFISNEQVRKNNRKNDLTLETHNEPVHIPETFLAKIIDELVDNAVKFSSPGAPINIKTLSNDGVLTIEVTNIGRGMTDEQIRAIDAYQQFDRTRYEQQGVGLGLILAKRLTEICDGKFIIKSAPQEQTTVTVRLRLNR